MLQCVYPLKRQELATFSVIPTTSASITASWKLKISLKFLSIRLLSHWFRKGVKPLLRKLPSSLPTAPTTIRWWLASSFSLLRSEPTHKSVVAKCSKETSTSDAMTMQKLLATYCSEFAISQMSCCQICYSKKRRKDRRFHPKRFIQFCHKVSTLYYI